MIGAAALAPVGDEHGLAVEHGRGQMLPGDRPTLVVVEAERIEAKVAGADRFAARHPPQGVGSESYNFV